MALQKKNRQAEETTNDEDTGEDFTIESKPRREVDSIIDEYKDEAGRRDATPKATIYKYDHEKTGNDKTFAGYFTGEEIPNRHNIGVKYGSGRYSLHIDLPKGTAQKAESIHLVFRIHSNYDELKRRADAERIRDELTGANTDRAGLPISAEAGGQIQAMQMMKQMFDMIIPLINRQQAAAQPARENPAELFNSYQMMQKLLKTNLFDTAETLKEYSRRFQIAGPDFQGIDDENETEEREPSLMEKIIEMIEPFFGMIAQKTPAAQMAAAGLRAAPQFAEILRDPSLCKMIVNHFDKTRGRQQSDIALKNIGINRAQLFGTKTPPAPASNPADVGAPAGRNAGAATATTQRQLKPAK